MSKKSAAHPIQHYDLFFSYCDVVPFNSDNGDWCRLSGVFSVYTHSSKKRDKPKRNQQSRQRLFGDTPTSSCQPRFRICYALYVFTLETSLPYSLAEFQNKILNDYPAAIAPS